MVARLRANCDEHKHVMNTWKIDQEKAADAIQHKQINNTHGDKQPQFPHMKK